VGVRRRKQFKISAGCLVLAVGTVFAGEGAHAQGTSQSLPRIDVTASRLGNGIVGTSTTVITAEEITRSPAVSLTDILARQPGIQVQDLFGMVAGARTTVDMRGFGAAAPSNTLVLVNGRRLNDIDMAGVDFAAIPPNSIERIEITRGNSGGVLYGDGAVGGVINIITKTGVGVPDAYRFEGGFGSFRYEEGKASLNKSVGPFAMSFYGNAIDSDAYRVNNELKQRNGVGEIRYTGSEGTAYLNVSADDQKLGLPGGRRVDPTTGTDLVATDPRGATTPFDFGNKQGVNATVGFTRMLGDSAELVVDGGVRWKAQQAGFFIAGFPDFDSFVDTTLTTYSVTPRLNVNHEMFFLPAKTIVGIDVYQSFYDSDRSVHQGDPAVHNYRLQQRTMGAYGLTTVALRPDTDVAYGGRIQTMDLSARDNFDPNAPGGLFAAAAAPLDTSETHYAAHFGVDRRLNETFALFGRVAHSFRMPNVDERLALVAFPVDFSLKTQTSQDIEGGVRVHWGRFDLQSSVYRMNLLNEIHFRPDIFANVNLDPTKRYGVENIATYQLTDTVRLKGGLAYTRAVFRDGPFAGHDVPLVSPWTASAGVSWNVWYKWLVFDAVARYFSDRRMDNDQLGVQPLIPPNTLVDLRLGGEIDRFFWSVSVQNIFDVKYFDYAVASAFTLGVYNAYPQPGRTFLFKGGATF